MKYTVNQMCKSLFNYICQKYIMQCIALRYEDEAFISATKFQQMMNKRI